MPGRFRERGCDSTAWGQTPSPARGGGLGWGEAGRRGTVRAPAARAPLPSLPRRRGREQERGRCGEERKRGGGAAGGGRGREPGGPRPPRPGGGGGGGGGKQVAASPFARLRRAPPSRPSPAGGGRSKSGQARGRSRSAQARLLRRHVLHDFQP